MHGRQRHSSAGSHCARHQWHSSGGSTPYCAKLRINEPWLSRNGAHLTGSIVSTWMLLETSTKDLRRMEKQLETGSVPGRIPFSAPEQDYITRYYAEGWYCLSIQWNYQIHQLAYCSRSGASNSVRVNMNYKKDVHMVHFSGNIKPSHWMFDIAHPGPHTRNSSIPRWSTSCLPYWSEIKLPRTKLEFEEHTREIT